jgi:peptidyl-prolyl cis-trans isomerase B (cyclophilin B)
MTNTRITTTLVTVVLATASLAALVPPDAGQAQPPAKRPAAVRPPPAPAAPTFFTTSLAAADLAGKQAVIETTRGQIVIDLLSEQAPNHVGYFIKLARDGAYNGTTFHRLISGGIIQGGDPLSKDPAKADVYGTGGLGVLKAEPGAGAHVRGAVSAVLVPGKRDSAGAQFFICVSPQAALDGQYTVFGRVMSGIGVVARISEGAVDPVGRAAERIEMTAVTIRDAPPAGPEPFSTESVAELATYQTSIDTSLGAITVEFFPEKAPNHVRNFLRLAAAGVYDETAFHRVVPGFVIQGGYMGSRSLLMDDTQQTLVRTLQPEFNDTVHDRGILSMARGDDPASASTSFFIVTGRAPALDGKYTAFGRVVAGLDVVEQIEGVARTGETPVERIEIRAVTVTRK